MHSYWLAIMAVCLAAAMGVWLALVFLADRNSSGRPQENSPQREVVGGTFEARRGGRQVMPDPTDPIVPEQRMRPDAERAPARHEGGA